MNLPLISVLALAALGLAFVLIELLARLYLRCFGNYYVWAPHARTRMELDRAVFPTLAPEARFDINECGERGDPLPRDDSDVYRILVAGGSATECYYIDQESTWPHVVQRLLSEPHNLGKLGAERVHVGNIARSLAASGHLLRIFERVLPRYEELDAIVLMVGASDVIRWLERGAPAEMGKEEIPASHVFAEHPEGPFGWRSKSLALRRIARYWNLRIRRPVEVRRGVGKRLARCRAMRARAKALLGVVPSPVAMLDRYERNLRRLIHLAQSRADRVIVVLQPWFDKTFTPAEEKLMWSFGAGCPHSEEVTAYFSHAVVWRLLRQVNARTVKVVEELEIQHVDLMPELDLDLETYYDELHHTPKGCAVIANGIVNSILRWGRSHETRENPVRRGLVGVEAPLSEPASRAAGAA